MDKAKMGHRPYQTPIYTHSHLTEKQQPFTLTFTLENTYLQEGFVYIVLAILLIILHSDEYAIAFVFWYSVGLHDRPTISTL